MTSSIAARPGSLARAREHRFYLKGEVMLDEEIACCNPFGIIIPFCVLEQYGHRQRHQGAAASPCRARNAISAPMPGERAHSADAAVKYPVYAGLTWCRELVMRFATFISWLLTASLGAYM